MRGGELPEGFVTEKVSVRQLVWREALWIQESISM